MGSRGLGNRVLYRHLKQTLEVSLGWDGNLSRSGKGSKEVPSVLGRCGRYETKV